MPGGTNPELTQGHTGTLKALKNLAKTSVTGNSMAAVIQPSLLDEDKEAQDGEDVFAWETWKEWLNKMTALGEEAVEVIGDHDVNGPVLSPRGMFLKQMAAWVGKVGGNFTHLFICYGVLKPLDGKQLTANDPLSSGEYMLKPCPLNGTRQDLNQN